MSYTKRCLVLAASLIVLAALGAKAQERPFDLHGIYLEGCTCKMVCTCSLEGAMAPGCHVMGALVISSGTFGDSSLAGVNVAFAIGEGWVRLYIQSGDPARSKTAGDMLRPLYSAYGTVESIHDAKIELSGSNGNYTLTVDDGKVMTLKTEPVLGADKKTAVTYTNYPDPLFQTIMQAKVISGTYKDDKHHFTLEGTNSFFNQNWSVAGKI
jgi:hypothetical protein